MTPLLLAEYIFLALGAAGAGLYVCYLFGIHATVLYFAMLGYLKGGEEGAARKPGRVARWWARTRLAKWITERKKRKKVK